MDTILGLSASAVATVRALPRLRELRGAWPLEPAAAASAPTHTPLHGRALSASAGLGVSAAVGAVTDHIAAGCGIDDRMFFTRSGPSAGPPV